MRGSVKEISSATYQQL